MRHRELLSQELRHAHDGDPWHGPPRMRILREVDADAAAWRPAAGVHSIWELALHMTAWTREVHRRLRGGVPALPEEGDWPPVPPDATAARWAETLTRLEQAHAELMATLEDTSEERLESVVGDARDDAMGTGITYARMLHGLAQHDAYHAGQAAILARIAASRSR